MSNHAKIAVVVPAQNAMATVERCVRSLAAQELDEPWEAVLVDNASADGTGDAARRAAEESGLDLKVVAGPGLGPGLARNAGAAATTAPLLAFLDSDCFAAVDWLSRGVEALAGRDLVQGQVRPDPDFVRGPFDRTLHVTGPSPLFESANLFVRRELFERLGGFQDGIEGHDRRPFGEDVWFGWRARRGGAAIDFCSEALAHHAVFREGAVAHILERRRLSHFAEAAARVPELRRELFFARVFLSPRTAAFDLALLGLVSRRRALALPYLCLLGREAVAWRTLAWKVAPVRLAADAVGFSALVRGSLKRRSAVL